MTYRKNLIDYYPPEIQKIREIRAICQIFQPELRNAADEITGIAKGHATETASSEYLDKLEEVYGIKNREGDGIDERRQRIKARMNWSLPPYTLRSLKQRLTAICGADQYTLNMDYEKLILFVGVELHVKALYSDVVDLLKRLVPANIQLETTLLFNTHAMLHAYTHEELKARTHFGWKGEEL